MLGLWGEVARVPILISQPPRCDSPARGLSFRVCKKCTADHRKTNLS